MEIKEYTIFNEEEIYNLYASVGWEAYLSDMSSLKEGFNNSLLVLGAYENDNLIGIIRAVGDGATIIFIQDILVHPNKQRKGVGRALIKEVINRYKNVRQIELVTDNTPLTTAFYKAMGFVELSKNGCCGFIYKKYFQWVEGNMLENFSVVEENGARLQVSPTVMKVIGESNEDSSEFRIS